MKRITSLALFALAGVLSVGSAFAQDAQIRATMPFDFTVGNKQLPSGTYTVTPVFSTVVALRSADDISYALSVASPDSAQSNTGAELVFDKVGDRYFLREILGGSNTVNASLPLARSEQRARSHETFAQSQAESRVVLALK